MYQDWRSWTQEGIIDIAMPMVYKAEHTATVRPQYDQWDSWLRGHLYNRAGVMGQGAFLNAIEGTLRQTRRTVTPAAGMNLSGIIFFSGDKQYCGHQQSFRYSSSYHAGSTIRRVCGRVNHWQVG
ncbi:MAG: hypothetical protein ABR568_02580 [Pyrinomonadaceae bacterium]